MGNFTQWAKAELTDAGWFSTDGFYGDMMGNAVYELMEVFEKQGHSGMSAPIAINLFKKLASWESINPIINEDDEWILITHPDDDDEERYQHRRCSALFKEGKDGRPYYIDAIVFDGSLGGSFTSNGSVETEDGTVIRSRAYVKHWPFEPKTFRVKVKDYRWKDKDEKVEDPDGDWWTHTLEDVSQLEAVKEYYDLK